MVLRSAIAEKSGRDRNDTGVEAEASGIAFSSDESNAVAAATADVRTKSPSTVRCAAIEFRNLSAGWLRSER